MKNRTLIAILPVLACFALLPAQAVTPPPDGCYPNFTTAEGCGALNLLTTGAGNTGLGWYALFTDDAGAFNTGVGAGALLSNTSDSNTAVGAAALLLNATGSLNCAVGTDAMVFNTDGSDNNAFGAFALQNNVSGFFNNAHGRFALTSSTGDENNAFGDDSMFSVTTGSQNTAIGDDSLDDCIDGSSNIAVGDEAGTGIVHGSNIIMIGVSEVSSAFGEADDTTYINHIFGEPVGVGPGQAVFVDSDGVLGFTVSSRRVKHDIKPMDKASEALYALKPVTFKYNSDKSGMTCFGLIAEDVAEVNPQLVLRDKKGEVSSVRYEQINSMLLNEFLKEHKKVEEQQASISQLKSEMQTMVAQLKEQAAQIQKVSAQLQVNHPAPQIVVNGP
jgi:hypothetical protein